MLNVEGRNIADEGFSGSNVRDSNTGRFTSEGANRLAQSMRAGMSMTSTRDSSTTNISAAVSKLTEAISNDTQNFQELLNKQDEKTKKLFDSYIKSLESGKTSNIEKAMEKFLLSMEKDTSKKFEKIIDAVGQRKSLNEGNTVKQKFAKFMGADADKGFGGSIAQAFSEPGRMFGTNRGFLGTGLFSGGPTAAQQEATAELGKENQTKGIAELVTNSVALDNSEDKSVSEIQAKNNKEKVAETGSSNKKGPEKVIIADQPIITKDAPKTMSGIDVNDPAAEQLQVLKDILEELKLISGKPSGGLGGGLGSIIPDIDLPSRRPRAGPRPRPGPRPGPGRLGNLGRFARGAGRFLGPVGLGLTAGMAAYDGFKGFNADEDATLGQKFQNAGRNIGSGLTFGLIDSVEEKMEDGSYQADREAENSQQSLQEAADRAGENGPQRQQRQAIIDRRNVVPSEGTATPAATTPGPVEGTATSVIPERDPNRFDGMSPSRAGFARQRESLEDQLAVKNAGGIMIGNEPFYPGQEEPLTEDQMARIEYGPGDIESFPPEVQEKYKQQMQDQGSSLATATPAATTPELVEGTAENVSTTPLTRRQRLERDLGFEGTTSGPVIPIRNAKEKNEREMELAEQMNLDPTKLDVEYNGPVPAVINGVAVPSELLTEDEKYQQNSAKAAREMLQGTQSEVAASQSVTSNAIQNMTNLSTPSTQSAPPIINNITNNNTSASPAAPQILTTPSTPRNNSNIIQRFQDRTFAGI